MNIVEFDYDLNDGFAWIVVDDKEPGNRHSVQCCIEMDNIDGQIVGRKEIKPKECGYDWGTCAEVNATAFGLWGKEASINALLDAAKEAGFKVED